MKNPFEKLFKRTPEQAEDLVRGAMAKELGQMGVNYHGIHNAYEAAQKMNEEKRLGLTRNLILNALREEAHAAASMMPIIEKQPYEETGGIGNLIDGEIENIRRSEQDKPQRS